MKKIVAFCAALLVGGILIWVVVANHDAKESTVPVEVDSDEQTSNPKQVSDNRTLTATPQPRKATNRRGAEDREPDPKKSAEAPTPKPEEWRDPVNQRVLGPKSWMAKVGAEEHEQIEATFKRAIAQKKHRVNSESRQNSIEAMRGGVTQCLTDYRAVEPDATGRVLVSWRASALKPGVGVVEDVVVESNVDLRDETFESCIASLHGLRFDGDIGRNIRVEYPFMFDENRDNPE